MKKMRKKFLSFFLAVTIFAVMGRFPVYAANTQEPANPVHHHSEEKHGTADITDWSYVYFGSYPQTEVEGENLNSDITGASYDENGDAWVNNAKYRRMSVSDTNNDGQYFRDDSGREYRYFKWERIRWRVMQNKGDTLFLISDKVLDDRFYHYTEETGYAEATWETCLLRQWLNNDFYSAAFSGREQAVIVEQTLTNGASEEAGNDTIDKIFPLSFTEVTNPEYGFCPDWNDKHTESRQMKASDYAHIKGSWTSDSSGTTYFWVRTSGEKTTSASYVAYMGHILQGDLLDHYNGVAPALCISKSSNLWYTEDDGTSGDGGDKELPDTDPAGVTVSCKNSLEIKEGQEAELSISMHGNTEEELSTWKDAAEIVVGDISILTVEKGNFTLSSSDAGADALWILKIKGVKPGKTTVDVKYQGNVAASCEVTVTPAAEESTNPPDTEQSVTPPENQKIKVKKLSISAISNKIAAGKKVALKVTVSPKNASNPKVEWKTDNKKYATVNSKGVVTTKKAGKGKTVKITATAKDGSGKKASIKIKLMKHAVTKVKIKKPAKDLKAGKSIQLKTTVLINGKNANNKLQWTVSNDKYASVNSKGKVTAKKAGKGKTVTVTAMSTDGTNKKASVKIRIK